MSLLVYCFHVEAGLLVAAEYFGGDAPRWVIDPRSTMGYEELRSALAQLLASAGRMPHWQKDTTGRLPQVEWYFEARPFGLASPDSFYGVPCLPWWHCDIVFHDEIGVTFLDRELWMGAMSIVTTDPCPAVEIGPVA